MTDRDLKFDFMPDAQKDMRDGCGYGSVGVFVSGIIWMLSSFMEYYDSSKKDIWTLIIGGVLIFPTATLIGELVGIISEQYFRTGPSFYQVAHPKRISFSKF